MRSRSAGTDRGLDRGDGVSRRGFLRAAGATGAALGAAGGLAGGLALAACGAPAQPAGGGGAQEVKPLKVQFLWIKNVESAGEWVADSQGVYQQEGVKPEFLAGGPNVDDVAVVSAGGADVGVTAGFSELVDANAKGSDFVAFAATFQKSPGGLLSLEKNPVRKPADLVKKRVGGQEGARRAIEAVLKINGLPLDYSWVPVGFDPQPLIEGACDVYTCYVTNQPLILAEKGIPFVAVTYSDVGFVNYGNVLFAKRAVLKEKRDAIVRYLKATIIGWERNLKDPNVAAKLAVETYGVDLGLSLPQQVAENKAQSALVEGDLTKQKGIFWMDRDTITTKVYKALEATGRTNLPKVDDFVDLTLLRDVYGNKTRLSS
jgi:ABC-type nitrate/sulfonate/bicarbonate transport system substrate-binding protein